MELKFVAAKKPEAVNVTVQRRQRLVRRLDQQISLIQNAKDGFLPRTSWVWIRGGRFRSDIAKQDQAASVLLIGHRQSLIKEAANRLGIDCYLDYESIGGHRNQRFGYAICLDSLPKVTTAGGRTKREAKWQKPPQYDVVILDESEQVISHLLSETLRERNGMAAVSGSSRRM